MYFFGNFSLKFFDVMRQFLIRLIELKQKGGTLLLLRLSYPSSYARFLNVL